jgi:GTP-binding protein Era
VPDLLQATVHVGSNSQKQVLIGKGGLAIKQVGVEARPEIEAMAGRPVYVELWVKVSLAWRKKAGFVQRTLQP